jgi:hypothetical protein
MPKPIFKTLFLVTTITIVTAQSWAHVPYIEHNDFSAKQPFRVDYSIEQSLAIYAWLENKAPGNSADIDVYVFQIKKPTNVYLEVIVPVCHGYEEFRPWFALAGPGLPEPKTPMPFDIPAGYGIEVIQNVNKGEPRETFYEFFGGKSYYNGPVFDVYLSLPGTYHVYFWDPQQKSGDYVAVFGKKEIWRFQDMIRAFRNTPRIRLDQELHVDCSKPERENWWDLGPATR